MDNSTIAAIATAAGRGAIGIVRLSGPLALSIGSQISNKQLKPRLATVATFKDNQQQAIDHGLVLFFPGPHSFTGEDCIELQAHGGPVVLDLLLNACLQHGARLARPGEFSERAYLNDKIDLAQAEAIADLIDASSQQSARNALHSLQGVFSDRVNTLADSIVKLRVYVEAAIDFPEEEIDFLSDKKVSGELNSILQQCQQLLQQSQQGAILREGIQVVIAGKPNAGKSSLLNALAEKNSAIVTNIAGTTRDVLREHIHIDGLPLHLIDTAGLRELSNHSPSDQVEAMGIERAQKELEKADVILWLVDSSELPSTSLEGLSLDNLWPKSLGQINDQQKLVVVLNKTDLSKMEAGLHHQHPFPVIALSAQNGEGLSALKQQLKTMAGLNSESGAGFTARRRHLDALRRSLDSLQQAQTCLASGSGELVAEDLRLAHQTLGEITGEFTADDLLGEIFSSFCIGK